MTLQRRLLNAMLGLLALAAITGISTIFLPGGDLIFRLSGTLVLAAIAIAIAIPVSKLLGTQADRTRGLVMLLAIVIGFCLSLAATWINFLFHTRDWNLVETTLAYVFTAAPAMVFLSISARAGGRTAGIAGMAFSAAVFGAWLMEIWWDNLSGTYNDNWGRTAGLFAAAAIPVSASLFGTLKSGRHWRFLGALAGAAGVLIGLYGVWIATGGKPTLVVHCFILAATVGGSNILARLPLPRPQVWLRWATIGTLVLTGLLGMGVNVLDADGMLDSGAGDNLTLRLFTAASIVTACGILALAVLMAFNRRFAVTKAKSLADIKTVTLVCPRCAVKQAAGLGESACTGCNLVFLIRVAEPHCAKCNYPLLDIRGGRCPECGEPIAPATGPSAAPSPAPDAEPIADSVA